VKITSKGHCGLGFFRTSETDVFNDACKNHDAAYVMFKGTRNERIRRDIDLTFLKEMKTKIKKKKLGKLSKVRAYIYYLLARIVGLFPWYLGKKGEAKNERSKRL
jgi:hypothetical protein